MSFQYKNVNYINNLIFFIFIILLIIIDPIISKKIFSKWITTSGTVSTVTPLSSPNNAPFFAGYDFNKKICAGMAQSMNPIQVNTANYTTVTFSLSGNSGTAMCYGMSNSTSAYNLQLVINYAALIYDFDFQWHCLNFEEIVNKVDPKKKDITNGLSCHCSGSMRDPQFSKCESDKLYNPQDMKFVDKLPIGWNATLEMCHNLNSRGPLTGCFLDFGADTDFYSKFYTRWNNYPMFKLKPRDIVELVIDVYLNEVFVSNISLSSLDPIGISTVYGDFVFNLDSFKFPESVLTDYVVFSVDGYFNNLDNIYMVHSSEFNSFDSFNPLKLCAIKQSYNTPIEYRKWEIDNVFKNGLVLTNCHPAEGKIQAPLADLRLLLNDANKVTSRVNPNTIALYPGETTLVKEQIEASMVVSVNLPGRYNIINTGIDGCNLSEFKFVCKDGLNQDGFHCTISYKVDTSCQISVFTPDSETVIGTYNSYPGDNQFDLIINPIYSSKDRLTLCGYPTWKTVRSCQTSYVNYTIENEVDSNNIEPETDENGNNGDSGIFVKTNSKFKAWFITIVTVGGLIFVLGIVWFCAPFIIVALKKMGSGLKSLKEWLYKKRTSINNEFSELDLPIEEEAEIPQNPPKFIKDKYGNRIKVIYDN